MDTSPIVYYLLLIPTILTAITCHEFAHAWVALKFGDRTAADRGRVSLNPLAHLDPLGTLALLVVGFGWGKPVPVNPNAFRSRWAELWVSAAGPGTNLLLAFLGGLAGRPGSSSAFAGDKMLPNPAVDLAPFGRWTLRDKAAQRRSP